MPCISVYNRCNNDCLMCTNPDRFKQLKARDFSLRHLTRLIRDFSERKKEFLENYRDNFALSGGEPTLHPELPGIMGAIRDSFPNAKITCLSNGRKFASSRYAERIVRTCDNLDLIIPVHAPQARLHDKISGVEGSFRQTIKGLENILKSKSPGQTLEIRIVIHRLNFRFLETLARFLKKEVPGFDRLVYLFFEIEGQALKNLPRLKLSYSTLAPHIEKVYGQIDPTTDIRFYHFPLCVIPARFYPHIWRTLPEFEVGFPQACGKCGLKNVCMGVHKDYLKTMGDSEFRPVDLLGLDIRESRYWHRPVSGVSVKNKTGRRQIDHPPRHKKDR